MENSVAVKPVEKLKSIMKAPSVVEQFENVLKDNTGPFVASIIDLYNSDMYLQNCEPKQVVMEALKAASLKLPVNKSLGFSYIVPFKTKNGMQAQCQIGYKGYIQLALRTGQYRVINADVVYEGELMVDSHNKLTGEIKFTGQKKSDKIIGYFAHIELLNGFSKTLYMTKEQVDAHAKKYSKSYSQNYSPWQTEFDAMAKKTVLRNLLSHYGYLSVEMISAMDSDHADVDERDRGIKEQANTEEISEDVQFEEVTENEGPDF